MRKLAYALLWSPLLLTAFIGGVLFERHRPQTFSLGELLSNKPSPTGRVATDPRTREVSREQKVAAAMQAIAAKWRMAIEGEDLFAVRHSDSCYSARFIRRGAKINADVKKTGTDHYVGIVQIGGMAATTGKFACFKSFAAALTASRVTAEDVEAVDATFTYSISDNGIRLDQAKSEPEWFARVLKYNLTDNPPSWHAVASQPIQ